MVTNTPIEPEVVLRLGLDIIAPERKQEAGRANIEYFEDHWGTSYEIIALVYNLMLEHTAVHKLRGFDVKHVLWGFRLLSNYEAGKKLARSVKEPGKAPPARSTFEKWAWIVAAHLLALSGYVVSVIDFIYVKIGCCNYSQLYVF